MIKKAYILILIVLFLVSCNMVFAEETLNETLEIEESYNFPSISNDDELNQNSINNGENLLQNEELNEESYIEIYVGQNKTVDGDGSADNPFATLNLACNNVSGQNKAIVNIYNGTYYLDSFLKFNTSNLFIKGIGGDVVIKNANNDKTANVDCRKAFGLTSGSANVTISNIIFDATDYTAGYTDRHLSMTFPRVVDEDRKYCFFPFYGETAMATFVNCSFMGFTTAYKPLNGLEYNSSYISCYFDNGNFGVFHVSIQFYDTGEYGSNFKGTGKNTVHTLKNCIFSNVVSRINAAGEFGSNSYIYLEDIWFSKNSYNLEDFKEFPNHISVSRYAVFNVVENYLGNNRYEIIGKLTWNGTDNQDGMENFQPMTVTLQSDNGYSETVTLTNGSFRTIYESDAKEHELTVTLDKQPIELLFNTTDIIVEPVSIYYGQDQNITINFSQVINSTVSITINNKTYNVKVNDSNTLIYSIQDMRLKEGNYTVDIILNDDINHVWGINSTEFKVSKVSDYLFEPNIPEDVKVGDIVPITVELPDDATGNLTVYVGFDEIPFTGTVSGTATVNISELTLGNNKITIVYSGDDKYVAKSSPAFIYAEKVSDYDMNITVPEKSIVGDDVTITIDLPKDINDEVTLIIDGERQEVSINKGVAEYTIKNISSGSHTITAVYSGNQRYDFNVNNKVFTVDKIQTTLKVESINMNADETATININLSEKLNTTIIVEINDHKQIISLENGIGQLTVSNLKEGTHIIKAKYEGDETYQTSTNDTATITVSKIDANLQANATNITVGENATINVEINKKTNGIVKIVLDKEYAVTIMEGKGSIDIPNLTNATYTAKVIFEGDDIFKSDETTVSFTVFKAKLPENINVTTNIPEGTTAPEFTIKLPNEATGNFTVYVDGQNYTEKLVNGSATVKVPEQKPGNHTISTEYSGDEKYSGFKSENSTMNVPKATVPGGENAINMTTPTDSATPTYSINLPGAKGNLTVTVDGKNNYTKALENGSATVSVPELASGKHNITVIYSGDDKYASISKNTIVDVPAKNTPAKPSAVKKQATKITAKKKTFKASKKVKKYTITLKAGKKPVSKVQVTIKVGKKTYKAKTNAKGKATFKIKKLTKKGKYKAVIKFKGNKTYKATSKKVKITIKK